MTAERDRFWHRPIGEHLAVGLAFDLPEGIASVSNGLLADWGVNGEEALAVACENLRQRSTQPFDSPAPGVFVSPWDDNYGASRLALTKVVREVEVKGSYVAIAPNRDTLIVTGSEDPAGLQVMLRLAEEAYRSPYRVSGIPVCLRNGRWEQFEPDAHHAALDGFRTLRLHSLGAAYTRQQTALRATPDTLHEGAFLATYTLASKGRNAPPTSYAVWTEDLSTLLPKVEKIAFVKDETLRGAGVAAFAEWGRVQEVVGDLMTPVDLYPQRFRVDRFPTAEQLKALGFAPGFEDFSQPKVK
jgi:hypothetical protein